VRVRIKSCVEDVKVNDEFGKCAYCQICNFETSKCVYTCPAVVGIEYFKLYERQVNIKSFHDTYID
jgi:hypothetical protein